MKKYTPKTRAELKKLVDDLEINLGDINTSKITNMWDLFFCSDRTNFDGIESWNVSNVKIMSCMFCYSNFNGDISNWNVSNVVDMCNMFFGSNFNGDISNWNVSNVRDMYSMFSNSNFNGDISSWNVSNVEDMEGMFKNSNFNGDISHWQLNKNVLIDDFTLNKIKGEQK